MAASQNRPADNMEIGEDSGNGGTMPPDAKKMKLDAKDSGNNEYNLEERLNGILCCAVCLDLPSLTFYQVRPWESSFVMKRLTVDFFSLCSLYIIRIDIFCLIESLREESLHSIQFIRNAG